MIATTPATSFDAILEGAPTGQTGIGVRALNPADGAAAIPRTTTGVAEEPAGSGTYIAALTAPGDGQYVLVWDPGTVTPDTVAVEDLYVTTDATEPPVRPGATVYRVVQGADTGLTGTIGVTVTDEHGATITPRATAGIVELLAGSGIYAAALTAPADDGSYLVVWDDGAGMTLATDTLTVTSALNYRPTVADVANRLIVRTVDRFGAKHGTFTADTRPTADQADALIDRAVQDVYEKVGQVPAALIGSARNAAEIRAAMLIEQSLYGDQIQAQRSPYADLRDMWTDALDRLFSAKLDLGADLEPGTTDDTSDAGVAVGNFPAGYVRAPGSESQWRSNTGDWRIW